jgi:hypothetical protein
MKILSAEIRRVWADTGTGVDKDAVEMPPTQIGRGLRELASSGEKAKVRPIPGTSPHARPARAD